MIPIRDTIPSRSAPVVTWSLIAVNALVFQPIAEVDDQTLILADVAGKAIEQLHESARELLARSQTAERAAELGDLLSTGKWTHDYPITFEEAKRLGLKVRSDMPAEVLELMSLYPQPVRRQPSVEYLPGERRREARQGGEGRR